jgi:hypothetical protein
MMIATGSKIPESFQIMVFMVFAYLFPVAA